MKRKLFRHPFFFLFGLCLLVFFGLGLFEPIERVSLNRYFLYGMHNLIVDAFRSSLNYWMPLGLAAGAALCILGTLLYWPWRKKSGKASALIRRLPSRWLAVPASLLLLVWLGLNVFSFARSGFFSSSQKSNVILVLLDTLRADVLSIHGAPEGRQPHLEAFVKHAVVFENVHSQHPSTPPSIQSMLTSLYPQVIMGEDISEEFRYHIAEEFLLFSEVLKNAGYRTIAFTDGGYTASNFNMDQGFQFYMDQREKEHDLKVKLNRVIEFFGEHQELKEEPFFFFFHTYQIHQPYIAKEPFKTMYYGEVNATEEDYRQWEVFKSWIPKKDFEARWNYDSAKMAKANYEGGVHYSDKQLGRFFRWLKKEGLYDDSLIVVTSDHGEMFMERPYILNHGGFLFQELVHVPLIIKFPNNEHKGRRVQSLGGLIDLAPTLADYLDIDIANLFYQGRSLIPAIEEGKAPNRFMLSQAVESGLNSVILDDVKYITPLKTEGFLRSIHVTFNDQIPADVARYYMHGGVYRREDGKENYLSRRIPKEYQYFEPLLESWRKDCKKIRDTIITEDPKARLKGSSAKDKEQLLPEKLRKDLEALGYMR